MELSQNLELNTINPPNTNNTVMAIANIFFVSLKISKILLKKLII